MKSTSSLVLVCLCLFAVAKQGVAVTTVLYPIEDAYLDSANPSTNFGASGDGYVLKDIYGTGAYFDMVVKFNISQLPSRVNSGFVTYNQQYVSADEIFGPYIEVNVYEIPTNWTEVGITWGNRPADLRGLAANYQDGDVNIIGFPITTAINDGKTAGKQTIAVRVHSDYPAIAVFMKESNIQYRPTLTVTF